MRPASNGIHLKMERLKQIRLYSTPATPMVSNWVKTVYKSTTSAIYSNWLTSIALLPPKSSVKLIFDVEAYISEFTKFLNLCLTQKNLNIRFPYGELRVFPMHWDVGLKDNQPLAI